MKKIFLTVFIVSAVWIYTNRLSYQMGYVACYKAQKTNDSLSRELGYLEAMDTVGTWMRRQVRSKGKEVTQFKIYGSCDTSTYILSSKTIRKQPVKL